MKALFKKLESIMTASAFAEAGEFETARQIMQEEKPRKTDRPTGRKRQRPSARLEVRAE
jgi:hypothetical protein